MKKSFLLLLLLLSIIVSKAQHQMFFESDRQVKIGLGYRNYPLLTAHADYGIMDNILEDGALGVGPYASLGISSRYTHLSGGVRGTFHYPLFDDFDTYAGVGIGVRYEFSSFYDNNTFFEPGAFIGVNYPISNTLNVFGEIGSGTAYLVFGFTFHI
jgi:hypothetical protein